jgi:hypothetical protein
LEKIKRPRLAYRLSNINLNITINKDSIIVVGNINNGNSNNISNN